eukprot:2436105-Prymnesium_polylepis.1
MEGGKVQVHDSHLLEQVHKAPRRIPRNVKRGIYGQELDECDGAVTAQIQDHAHVGTRKGDGGSTHSRSRLRMRRHGVGREATRAHKLLT